MLPSRLALEPKWGRNSCHLLFTLLRLCSLSFSGSREKVARCRPAFKALFRRYPLLPACLWIIWSRSLRACCLFPLTSVRAASLRRRGRSGLWTIGEASSLIIITRLFNFFRVRACPCARARPPPGGGRAGGCAETSVRRRRVCPGREVEVAHLHHRVPQSAAAAAAAAAHFVTDLRLKKKKKRAQPHVENEIILCFPLLLKKKKRKKKPRPGTCTGSDVSGGTYSRL